MPVNESHKNTRLYNPGQNDEVSLVSCDVLSEEQIRSSDAINRFQKYSRLRVKLICPCGIKIIVRIQPYKTTKIDLLPQINITNWTTNKYLKGSKADTSRNLIQLQIKKKLAKLNDTKQIRQAVQYYTQLQEQKQKDEEYLRIIQQEILNQIQHLDNYSQSSQLELAGRLKRFETDQQENLLREDDSFPIPGDSFYHQSRNLINDILQGLESESNALPDSNDSKIFV